MIPYNVIFTGRRTFCICLRPNGVVEARAPKGMSLRQVQELVEQKAEWVITKREELLARQRLREETRLERGQQLEILGEPWRLEPAEGEPPGFGPDGVLRLAGASPEQWRQSILEACRTAARGYFPGRVAEIAETWGFCYTKVTVTGAKTRWGSCSGKNSLCFSQRLALASRPVADYVILHELAHTREHNHSPRFWAVVETYMPDYRQRREELHQLHDRLSLLDL